MERRPEAVHLYGVDRLSTRECMQYFEEYGPARVEWLDDSSCNVVFADPGTAKRAMIGKGRPFGPNEAEDLQGEPQFSHLGASQKPCRQHQWYPSLKPY